MKDKLKEYGLTMYQKDDPNREPIDFTIADSYGNNVCWVWGKTPEDTEVDCNHPYVEYGDDDERGECKICGATCDWHWEESADDGYTIQEHMPHAWYIPDRIGGIIGEYLNELKNKGDK